MSSPAGTCWTCGHETATGETDPAQAQDDATDQIPLVEWNEPAPEPNAVAASHDRERALSTEPAPKIAVSLEAVPASRAKGRSLALVGGAGVLACVMAIVVLQSLQPAASPQPVATIPASSAKPTAAPAAPILESAPAPAWVGNQKAAWANDGSKTISFELQATRDVNVWMSRMRPLLVVRCLYRTTEVFVAIQSAASIEGQSGSHTVRLQIDDDQEVAQQWNDSTTGHELFSPDSVALARRLASAKRLRFSFTPYNAPPATAEFAVEGFDTLAGLVGNTCGWKVDESSPPPQRMAKRR